jgi:PilZ domain
MKEGRLVPRRHPRRRVRVRVVTPRGSSLTTDVGPGGFSTSVMRILPVDSRFEGTISVRGQDEHYTGRVVWARPGNPRLGIAGAFGVCFESISQHFASDIADTSSTSVPG